MLRLSDPNGKELVTPELLETMQNAGLTKIGYGVESLSSNIQQSRIRKAQDFEYVRSVIQYGNDLGLLHIFYLMLGFPEETRETIQETKDNLKKLVPDELKISFLTPFPGTKSYEEFHSEGRLLTTDISLYDTTRPIVRVDNLTTEEVKKARDELFEDFYSSEEHRRMVGKKISRYSYLKASYDSFYKILNIA